MAPSNIRDLIVLDRNSAKPKYLQVSEGVIRAIEERKLGKGDQLPSLRHLSEALGISFDTAKKAYDVLKKKNIVVAAQGKSNVVNATGPIPVYKIFLLFNKLGSHKRLLYEAFSEAFISRAEIDLHVYNNDLRLFRHLLETKATGYTHYVIIPHLSNDPAEVAGLIDRYLGGRQIVLLDKRIEGVRAPHASVYEDFGGDIYHALNQVADTLKRYSVIHMVYPEASYYAPEIMKGFELFCGHHHFTFKTHTGTANDIAPTKGSVFILLSDDDLPRVIQKIRSAKLRIGEDVGIISYNETPLKEVLLDGITTISTDFKKMGRLAAGQVITGGIAKIAVPIRLRLRKTL